MVDSKYDIVYVLQVFVEMLYILVFCMWGM
jgi:hypothetical protein